MRKKINILRDICTAALLVLIHGTVWILGLAVCWAYCKIEGLLLKFKTKAANE